VAMLAGVPEEEVRPRIGRIAAGLGHWAIPPEEALHLCATVQPQQPRDRRKQVQRRKSAVQLVY